MNSKNNILKHGKKRNKKKRLLKLALHLLIIYIFLLGIFAFSGVAYLSDATFIFATFPVFSFIVLGLFVYIVYRYYPKNNIKIRKIFIVMSVLSLIVMAMRTTHFAITENKNREQVKYSDLISDEKKKVC